MPTPENAAHSDRQPATVNAATLAMAKIANEAASRERAMWLRFVKQVNAMTRDRVTPRRP